MDFILYVFPIVFILSFCIVIIIDNKNPVHTVAWLIVIIALPVAGVILYLMLGRNYKKNRLYQKLLEEGVFRHASEVAYAQKGSDHQRTDNFEQFITRNSFHPAFFNNETRLYFEGKKWLAQLLDDIAQAHQHIHMEFYILRHDTAGRRVRDALLRQADNGVTVRLLLDRVGSWQLAYLHRSFLQPLFRHPNVEFSWFYPTRVPFIQIRINYRNHRKIVIIDGEVGYTGGMNIADEYMEGGKFAYWRDAQLRIEGYSVHSLQVVFLVDWYTAKKGYLFNDTYFPVFQSTGVKGVQIVPGGPDQRWESIAQAYFRMITDAREEVLISSPYLIPDEPLLMALKTAALRGVQVKLLVPDRPDHQIVFWASCSYYGELLRAGVRIFAYQKGFVHAKIVVCDNLLASVGSANFDLRSLYTNFEINALLYDPEDIHQLRSRINDDISNSRELTRADVNRWPWPKRFRHSVARLFSPLV